MARRSIRKAVDDALDGQPDGWRTVLARKLAAALDEQPNASMARELRAVMADIAGATVPKETSFADQLRDELQARRTARQASAEAE